MNVHPFDEIRPSAPLAIFARRIRETFAEHPAHAEAFRDALFAEGTRQLKEAARAADSQRLHKIGRGMVAIEAAYERAVKS